MKAFEKDWGTSISTASLEGPKTAKPLSVKKFDIPSTRARSVHGTTTSLCVKSSLHMSPILFIGYCALSVVVVQQSYPTLNSERPVVAIHTSDYSKVLHDTQEQISNNIGIMSDPGFLIFHNGIQFISNELVACGGRVATCCGWTPSAKEARELTYQGLDLVSFKGSSWRSDIGLDAAKK